MAATAARAQAICCDRALPESALVAYVAALADIGLTTFNAKFAHALLGLRALRASLGALRERSVIREVVCGDKPSDVDERLLEDAPKIIDVGGEQPKKVVYFDRMCACSIEASAKFLTALLATPYVSIAASS